MNSYAFLNSISEFGFWLAILLMLGQLVIRKKVTRNYILAALFLCMAVVIKFTLLLLTGDLITYSWLCQLDRPFGYLIGPLVYLLFLDIIDENFTFSYRDFYHFLPAVSIVFLNIPFYFLSSQEKAQKITQFRDNLIFGFNEYLALIGLLISLVYFMIMIIKGRFLWEYSFLKKQVSARLLLSFIIIFISILVLIAVALIMGNVFLGGFIPFLITFGLVNIFLTTQRFPEFFQDLQKLAVQQKYKKSLLESIDVNSIEIRLKEKMEIECLYKNELLSLKDLAENLEISTHQLSELLNTRYESNFSNFINNYRIGEAKKILSEISDASILNIAFAVGFNSKSAFNRAFLKISGCTPSEFREKTSRKS